MSDWSKEIGCVPDADTKAEDLISAIRDVYSQPLVVNVIGAKPDEETSGSALAFKYSEIDRANLKLKEPKDRLIISLYEEIERLELRARLAGEKLEFPLAQPVWLNIPEFVGHSIHQRPHGKVSIRIENISSIEYMDDAVTVVNVTNEGCYYLLLPYEQVMDLVTGNNSFGLKGKE